MESRLRFFISFCMILVFAAMPQQKAVEPSPAQVSSEAKSKADSSAAPQNDKTRVAQPPSAVSSLEPTETQKLKLENLQLRAQLALERLNQAKQQYDQAIGEFFTECEAVKKENGWDKQATCNIATLKFRPAQKE